MKQIGWEYQRAAALCGLTAVGYLLCNLLLQWGCSALLGMWVPGASLHNPAGISAGGAALLQLLVTAVSLALPAWGAVRAGHVGRISWMPTGRAERHFWTPVFLGSAMLANLAVSAIQIAVGRPPAAMMLPEGGWPLFFVFLALCPVAAVGEEYLFRGVLQGLLRPLGGFTAVIGAAVPFALLHGSLAQGAVAFVCGLVLGLCALNTGSIRLCIGLHLINNLLSFIAMYLAQYGDPVLAGVYQTCLLVVCPVWGIAVYLRRPRPAHSRPAAGGLGLRGLAYSPVYLLAMGTLALVCVLRTAGV